MRYAQEQKPLVEKRSVLNPLASPFVCDNGVEKEDGQPKTDEIASPVADVSEEWKKVINGQTSTKIAESICPRYKNRYEILRDEVDEEENINAEDNQIVDSNQKHSRH